MRLKNARHRPDMAIPGMSGTPAFGSPVTAGRHLGWPAVKRAGIILAAGLVLAFLTSNLDARHRGAAPLLCASGAFLVAILDFHRADRRIFALLLGVLPLAMLAAFAAVGTPATEGATAQATTLGTQASSAVPAELFRVLGDIGEKGGTWLSHEALPWIAGKLGDIPWPWSS